MMKTRQNNDVIDRICAVYAEKEIELLWLVGLGVVCDRN